MTLCGWRRGSCRVRRRDASVAARHTAVIAVGASLMLLAAVTAAAIAAGCGGSPEPDEVTAFLGQWERVEAGAPDPDFALAIEATGDGVSITFANLTNGMSQTVAGTVQDGSIACMLASTDDPFLMPAGPGTPSIGVATAPPASVSLQLSLDETGQLVVDLVLPDGTLQPIWIYQRIDGGSPPAPGTL